MCPVPRKREFGHSRRSLRRVATTYMHWVEDPSDFELCGHLVGHREDHLAEDLSFPALAHGEQQSVAISLKQRLCERTLDASSASLPRQRMAVELPGDILESLIYMAVVSVA